MDTPRNSLISIAMIFMFSVWSGCIQETLYLFLCLSISYIWCYGLDLD